MLTHGQACLLKQCWSFARISRSRVRSRIVSRVVLLRNLSAHIMNTEAQFVLDYWFGTAGELNFKLWFKGGKEVDDEIRETMGPLIEKARTGQLKSWEENDRSALAHIILIDQFCRSVYRGTAKAFDCDPISLRIAKQVIDNGKYQQFNCPERFFLNLPFEHSENVDDQNRSCALYEELVADHAGTESEKLAGEGLRYAKLHREVIQNCGRFPKRNKAIGRENTPEEEELLKNYPYPF